MKTSVNKSLLDAIVVRRAPVQVAKERLKIQPLTPVKIIPRPLLDQTVNVDHVISGNGKLEVPVFHK